MENNIINEKENNMNIYNNLYNIGQLDNLNIDDMPGFFHNKINNKSNNDLNQENNNFEQYLFPNEEIIPYSPEMSEEPIHPNQSKQLNIDNIINKKRDQFGEEIFTFKNNNKKGDNFNFNKSDKMFDIFKDDINMDMKMNMNNIIENNNKEIDLDRNKIKASILNFEDIITKENNELLNKSKNIMISKEFNNLNNVNNNSNENALSNNINNSNSNNKELNIIKKESHKSVNSKNSKNSKNKINNNNNFKKINKNNKSQKRPNQKIKIFDNNSTLDGVEFENFMKEKNLFIPANTTTTKNINKNMSKINDINNDLLIRKTIKKRENTDILSNFKKLDKSTNTKEKKTKRKINNIIRKTTSLINQNDISLDKIIINKNNKRNKLNISKDKTLKKNKSNKSFDDNNSILTSKSQIIKRKRANTLRNTTKKIEDTKVPLKVTELEFNSALKNEKIGKNIQKRFSNINNDIIKFDNSKFIKYDTDQILYGLIKDYSNIHPEKGEGFLQRMQFESLKRKNKDIKIKELLEKNKKQYKMKETQREKAFDRLIDDANRRLILKQEMIENEKYLMDYKDLMNNEKKYNKEEWNDIYKKRFSDYEECKKKKIEIQRQNEKIKKMLKEEEEINMCQMKKIPAQKIRENTQRLYDDAKKREYIKRKNMSSANSIANYKKNKKKDINLTSFDDEEDASKYMKGFRSQAYSFIGDDGNNNNYYNNHNINFLNFNNNRNQNQNQNYFDNNNNYYYCGNNNYSINVNKSFDKKNKNKSKISVTEFNNLRFDTRKNNPKSIINKKNQNNFEKNEISTYFDYKKSKQNGFSSIPNNNISSQFSYGYNYNNYNIYNINNLNNNINSIHNLNNNDEENDMDNYNLNNIAEQLLHTAAMNKISNQNNKNNLYHSDNNYSNINFNRNNNDNNNTNIFNTYNDYADNYKKIDNRINYEQNEQNIETTQMINQFLLNQYDN